MRAAQFSEYGKPSVIEVREVDRPEPSDDQVLVRVHASSINPFDSKVRAGFLKDMMPINLPATIGGDMAGVIEKVGKNVTALKPGDRVFGSANVVAGDSGAMAEFAVTSHDHVARGPKQLSDTEAASMVLVGLSAMQGLVDALGLKKDQTILIQGAAGGIGSAAVQLAKYLGAHVVATARGEGVDFVKELGADQVIDFEKTDFTTSVQDVDAVFDTVGGHTFEQSFRVVKKGGKVISMAAQANAELDAKYGVTSSGMFTKTTTTDLTALAELISAGACKPHIARTFPLSDVREAFETFEIGGIQGKIAISIS